MRYNGYFFLTCHVLNNFEIINILKLIILILFILYKNNYKIILLIYNNVIKNKARS